MGGMIPLGDASRRTARWPIVTVLLIVANLYVFTRELMFGEAFIFQWSTIPAEIVSGQGWMTLLTSMFLHASWLHIVGNMIYLWAFGPEIEDAMGRMRFVAFYLVGGLLAMSAQVLAMPGSIIPSLGASGAIAAVMGAFLVTYPRDRIRTALWFLLFIRIAFVPAALVIGFWFLMQLFNAGAVTHSAQTGGVAYVAHICGFLFGVVTGRLWKKRGQT